jgi:hypothetical protein
MNTNEESTKTPQQVQRDRDTEALIKLWQAGMPSIPPPDEKQWQLWWRLHNDIGVIAYGLQECARLYLQRRGVMDLDHAVRHSSKCMNCLQRDRARRKKSSEHWPLNILTKNLAEAIGQPELAGIGLSESMYWRVQMRALAIRQGRIPAPSPTTEPQSPPATQPATPTASHTGDQATG